jgi:RNA polymerase sigma factor (sigma-70 family)
MVMPEPIPGPSGDQLTSIHVRRAAANDRASLAWLVSRFTPLLLCQAHQRLTPSLRSLYDADDVVADVWMTVLGALPRLVPSQGSMTVALLRYAGTVLIHRIRDLLEKHVINKPTTTRLASPDSSVGIPAAAIAPDAREIVSLVISEERSGLVWSVLSELDPKDREILVLRGIEGRPHKEIGALLAISAENAMARYHRALQRLRARLPSSVFDELGD